MDHNTLVTIGIACMFALAWLGWARRCSCEKCAFHRNEDRMERLRAAETAEKYKADQATLRHDYEHKGGGFRDGDPDRFNCPDDTCARNPRRVD